MMHIVKLLINSKLSSAIKYILGGLIILFWTPNIYSQTKQSEILVSVEIVSDKSQNIQLFYKSSEGSYNEYNSTIILYDSRDKFNTLEITGKYKDELNYFRLDFGQLPNINVTIKSLKIKYQNKEYEWSPIEIYYAFYLAHLDVVDLSEDGISFKTKFLNGFCDPYISLMDPIVWKKQKVEYTKTTFTFEYKSSQTKYVKMFFISDAQKEWSEKYSYPFLLEAGSHFKMKNFEIYSQGRIRNIRIDLNLDSTFFSLRSIALRDMNDSIKLEGSKLKEYFSGPLGVDKVYTQKEVNYILKKEESINANFIGREDLVFDIEKSNKAINFYISFLLMVMVFYFINKLIINENWCYWHKRNS